MAVQLLSIQTNSQKVKVGHDYCNPYIICAGAKIAMAAGSTMTSKLFLTLNPNNLANFKLSWSWLLY